MVSIWSTRQPILFIPLTFSLCYGKIGVGLSHAKSETVWVVFLLHMRLECVVPKAKHAHSATGQGVSFVAGIHVTSKFHSRFHSRFLVAQAVDLRLGWNVRYKIQIERAHLASGGSSTGSMIVCSYSAIQQRSPLYYHPPPPYSSCQLHTVETIRSLGKKRRFRCRPCRRSPFPRNRFFV